MGSDFIKRAIRCVGFFPVILCLFLVAWSYFAVVYALGVRTLLPQHPVQAWLCLVLVQPLFFLFMWSYFVAVFTYPGSISGTTFNDAETGSALNHRDKGEDDRWRIDDTVDTHTRTPLRGHLFLGEEDTVNVRMEQVTVKQNGKDRYCKKCLIPKPDRAHHCRVCRDCILKMDHHCPWINGCVGHHNQKAFLLFIFYGGLYCWFILAAVSQPMYQTIWGSEPYMVDLNVLFLALASLVFGIALIGLSVYHLYLVLNNLTTIESLQRNRYRHEFEHLYLKENIFDLGYRKNVEQVFGPRWPLWFVPIRNTLGDGRIYPIRMNARDI